MGLGWLQGDASVLARYVNMRLRCSLVQVPWACTRQSEGRERAPVGCVLHVGSDGVNPHVRGRCARRPVDVIVARKVGVPGLAEVALGAIAEDCRGIVEDSVGWYIGVPRRVVERIAERERAELERRVRLYRSGRALPDVRGKTVVLVDDGLASGATLRAAVRSLKARRPKAVIAAIPVASPLHCDDVRATVDDLVTLATPEPFGMVSSWYEDYSPVSDAEVLRLLCRLPVPVDPEAIGDDSEGSDERVVSIPVDGAGERQAIVGDLELPNVSPADRTARDPAGVRGLVIFAHGGGSSRRSYRNRYLAGRLRMAGWATLRIDLLLEAEGTADGETGALRFDVELIGGRLRAATEWAARERIAGAGRIVLFGASTGAAAAVATAAARPALVAGVVSRGGRVDLAGEALHGVCAPMLMVVGGADLETLQRNRDAARHVSSPTRVAVVPGAGHTFEEPGALGAVGEHVVRWLDGLGSPEPRRWNRLVAMASRGTWRPGRWLGP